MSEAYNGDDQSGVTPELAEAFDKAVELDDGEALLDLIDQYGEPAHDLFMEAAPFFEDSPNTRLAQLARAAVRKITGDDVKDALLDQHNGDLTGVELASPQGDRFAVLSPDASQPGHYRVTFFDEHGFSGHQSGASWREVLDRAFASGTREPVSGVLDRLASFESFRRGSEVADLIGQLNDGRLDWDAFKQQRMALAGSDTQSGDTQRTADLRYLGETLPQEVPFLESRLAELSSCEGELDAMRERREIERKLQAHRGSADRLMRHYEIESPEQAIALWRQCQQDAGENPAPSPSPACDGQSKAFHQALIEALEKAPCADAQDACDRLQELIDDGDSEEDACAQLTCEITENVLGALAHASDEHHPETLNPFEQSVIDSKVNELVDQALDRVALRSGPGLS